MRVNTYRHYQMPWNITVPSAHSNPSALLGSLNLLGRRHKWYHLPPAAPGTCSICGVCVETAPAQMAASDLSSWVFTCVCASRNLRIIELDFSFSVLTLSSKLPIVQTGAPMHPHVASSAWTGQLSSRVLLNFDLNLMWVCVYKNSVCLAQKHLAEICCFFQ